MGPLGMGRGVSAVTIHLPLTTAGAGVEARDALLAVLGLVLVTVNAAPQGVPGETTPWHGSEGAFHGMVG